MWKKRGKSKRKKGEQISHKERLRQERETIVVESVGYLDAAVLRACAAKSENGLLDRCLGQSSSKILKVLEPSEVYPLLGFLFLIIMILGVLFKIFRSNASRKQELDRQLRIDSLNRARIAMVNQIQMMFLLGAGTTVISNCIDMAIQIACEQARMEGHMPAYYFNECHIISIGGKVNLEFELNWNYYQEHPLLGTASWCLRRGTASWCLRSPHELSKLYVFLALKGDRELILWSLDRRRSTWDTKKEIDVVRIAAFLGHTDVVDIFVRDHTESEVFFSSKTGRFHAAILGAAEAGRVADMMMYLDECKNLGLPLDPIVSDLDVLTLGLEKQCERIDTLASSLVGSVVSAFLNCSVRLRVTDGQISDGHRSVLKWIILNSGADVRSVVHAAALTLPDSYEMYAYERCTDLLLYLVYEMNLDIWCCQEGIDRISKLFCEFVVILVPNQDADRTRLNSLFVCWLKLVSDLGFDIQLLELSMNGRESRMPFAEALASCQATQLRTWSHFDRIKEDLSLDEIKLAIENGDIHLTDRDKNGLLFTDLAAAYDRSDVLQWLVETKDFQAIWNRSISMLASTSSLRVDYSWGTLKQQEHDIMCASDFVDDLDQFSETTQKLDEAVANALSEMSISDEIFGGLDPEDDHFDSEESSVCMKEQTVIPTWQSVGNLVCIKLTSHVVKWLRRGDRKYRDFFVRRIEQLASGQRSRILNKRLTGSKTTIYETYLEQKSGYRILWTESKDQSLLIWYVAKHKDVSRLIGLIDDAESRSSRQLVCAAVLSSIGESAGDSIENENAEMEQILLDPLGDTPLKLYEVHPDELDKLTDPSWKPQLYLTAREREVVKTIGTVLLLGRSGTGKTCVICNRMYYDRQRAGGDPGFSQLFVARYKRLCDYVRHAVVMGNSGEEDESAKGMRFETFGGMIESLESQLPVIGKTADFFLPSRKMGFVRFKREVYGSDSSRGLDALIVWTNIRSFIKGSIEALQHRDGILTEEEYLALGKRRCRLSLEQRQCVYAMFARYDKYMKAKGLWDDCDRIKCLARRLEYARETVPDAFECVHYNKLYVDEVQDYTQAEIAIFFYMCGPGDLFLAGDSAQSVVEGVEFRFEEIRSVGYRLYGGETRRHLIPDKPKTVHLNFRSHCGILNVAAAILSCMFEAFPDGAKQLKEDRGLFQGPRPGVFHNVEVARLRELVMKRKGVVVLAHDHDVSQWKRSLDYPLVCGIREVKGLEFQEVILVDFFGGVPDSLQKPLRDLLLGRDLANVSRHPEVEGHLKLLYTAVTRCIQRLFFAETSSSIAGDAFVRWLTTTTRTSVSGSRQGKEALAVKSSVENVETMERTPDEWRSAGLDNAAMAESSEELYDSEGWLEKAIYCFEQVGDTLLASKARTHKLSVRFRLNLEDVAGGDNETANATQTELDAAVLTEKLLAEGLLLEAREVCCSILPFLSVNTQNMLQAELIARLPDGK